MSYEISYEIFFTVEGCLKSNLQVIQISISSFKKNLSLEISYGLIPNIYFDLGLPVQSKSCRNVLERITM